MPYNIKRANGDLYAVVAENIILGPNSPEGIPAPINLIGRNKVSFGLAQNENFLWLTENFASDDVPNSSIKGQLWYCTATETVPGAGGELLLAPVDNLSDKSEWLTVPLIARVSNEPSSANEGRMIIHKNDTLKVYINNEWRTVSTGDEQNSIFRTLLPIRYFDDNTIISVTNPDYDVTLNPSVSPSINVKVMPHEGNIFKNIASFNEGGAIQSGSNIVVSGDNALKFGNTYRWSATISARDAEIKANTKSWYMSGTFSVSNVQTQKDNIDALPADSSKYMRPDPRILKENFDAGTYANSCVKEVLQVTGTADNWDITVVPRLNWPDALNNLGTATTPEDIVNGDYFGMMFRGLVDSNINVQWSINFELTGIPQITPGSAASITP